MKICIIGCGGHASQVHGPAQRKYAKLHPDTVLSACCDLDVHRAFHYKERFGFQNAYDNASEMLDRENPDAVCIVVPTAATAQVAIPVLKRGIPVFLEKPPGSSCAELEDLIAAAETGDGRQQVAFNRRHMPVLRQAVEILDSEMPPDSVFRIDYEMIRNDRRDTDFSTTAVHVIDAALYLARSPYRRAEIDCRALEQFGPGVAGIEMRMECESGTEVALNIQPVGGQNSERIHIHACGSSLLIEFPVMGLRGPGASLCLWRDDLKIISSSPDDHAEDLMGFYAQTEHFFDSVRANRPLRPTLSECRQQVELMEAVRERTGAIDWVPNQARQKRTFLQFA
jgi:predicted dehydrogenase